MQIVIARANAKCTDDCVCYRLSVFAFDEYAAMGISTRECKKLGWRKMRVDNLACAAWFTKSDSDCSVLAYLFSTFGKWPKSRLQWNWRQSWIAIQMPQFSFFFAVAELSHILSGGKQNKTK